MKKLLFLLSILVTVINFTSCDPEDVIGNQTQIDSDTLDYEWDTTNVVKIHLAGTSIVATNKNVTVNGTIATITAHGTYEIDGTLSNGQIIVNADGIVRLILNNVSLTNLTTSPLLVEQADKTIVILPTGTINTITDGATYVITPDSLNATIYSKDYIAFYGEGKLTVNGNYNTGISSKDELIIQSGNLEVNSVGIGIKGKDWMKIYGGNITVKSGSDGIKSDKDSTENFGFIEIYGGDFNINSVTDAISAKSLLSITSGNFVLVSGGGSTITPGTISTKGLKAGKNLIVKGGTYTINSSDNCIDAGQNIEINSGNFTLLSGNKPVEADSNIVVNNGEINITKAYKGISAYSVSINGGNIKVVSTNDCVKATLGTDLTTNDGSSINVNGGNLLLSSSKGDALDSNGSIAMKGGIVVVQGSSTLPDDAISYRSTFNVVGGIIAACGATTLSPNTTTSQNTVLLKFKSLVAVGTLINIQKEDGTSIMTFKTSKQSYSTLLSSPLFLTGSTYKIYTSGSVIGTELNGFYPDGVYTIGTLRTTFSIATNFTTLNF